MTTTTKKLASLLAACLLLLCLALSSAAAEQEGRLYLYGESHANQTHLDQELAAWKDYYHNQGMRDLFLEVPFYTAEFMNLWMKAEGDAILTRLYEEWEGTAMDSQNTWDFYQTIKAECPETVFHGFDVGHQYSTTGARYIASLLLTGQIGSEDWDQAQAVINQGKTYYQTGDEAYRENQMTANLIAAYEALPEGASVMVITGSAHSDLFKNDLYTGTTPCMANQLRQKYGSALIARNLTAGFDYSRAGAEAVLSLGGKEYTAVCLADQDLRGQFPLYQSRTFWLIQDAYQDVKSLPISGEILPYDNYPADLETGQVFAVDYRKTDGTAERRYYRADGTLWEGKPATAAFTAG